MENKLTSGKEVIKNFISNMGEIPEVDKKTTDVISELFQQGKLSEKNLQNALDNLLQDELKNNSSQNE